MPNASLLHLTPFSRSQALCLTLSSSLNFEIMNIPHSLGLTSCMPLKFFFPLLILSASEAVKTKVFFFFTLTVSPSPSLLSASRCRVIFFFFCYDYLILIFSFFFFIQNFSWLHQVIVNILFFLF